MSPVHQVWQKKSCKAQWKGEEDKAEEEVGRQHQGMNRPGVRQVPEGSGEEAKMEKTGAKSFVVPQQPYIDGLPSTEIAKWNSLQTLL